MSTIHSPLPANSQAQTVPAPRNDGLLKQETASWRELPIPDLMDNKHKSTRDRLGEQQIILCVYATRRPGNQQQAGTSTRRAWYGSAPVYAQGWSQSLTHPLGGMGTRALANCPPTEAEFERGR